MIGNILGRHITALIDSGIVVYMNITVANRLASWNPFWLYIMAFVFFGITGIILGYFIFVIVSRFYQNRQLRIQQVRYLPAFGWPLRRNWISLQYQYRYYYLPYFYLSSYLQSTEGLNLIITRSTHYCSVWILPYCLLK